MTAKNLSRLAVAATLLKLTSAILCYSTINVEQSQGIISHNGISTSNTRCTFEWVFQIKTNKVLVTELVEKTRGFEVLFPAYPTYVDGLDYERRNGCAAFYWSRDFCVTTNCQSVPILELKEIQQMIIQIHTWENVTSDDRVIINFRIEDCQHIAGNKSGNLDVVIVIFVCLILIFFCGIAAIMLNREKRRRHIQQRIAVNRAINVPTAPSKARIPPSERPPAALPPPAYPSVKYANSTVLTYDYVTSPGVTPLRDGYEIPMPGNSPPKYVEMH